MKNKDLNKLESLLSELTLLSSKNKLGDSRIEEKHYEIIEFVERLLIQDVTMSTLDSNFFEEHYNNVFEPRDY